MEFILSSDQRCSTSQQQPYYYIPKLLLLGPEHRLVMNFCTHVMHEENVCIIRFVHFDRQGALQSMFWPHISPFIFSAIFHKSTNEKVIFHNIVVEEVQYKQYMMVIRMTIIEN